MYVPINEKMFCMVFAYALKQVFLLRYAVVYRRLQSKKRMFSMGCGLIYDLMHDAIVRL